MGNDKRKSQLLVTSRFLLVSKPGIQVDSNVDQFGVTYPFPRQFGDRP